MHKDELDYFTKLTNSNEIKKESRLFVRICFLNWEHIRIPVNDFCRIYSQVTWSNRPSEIYLKYALPKYGLTYFNKVQYAIRLLSLMLRNCYTRSDIIISWNLFFRGGKNLLVIFWPKLAMTYMTLKNLSRALKLGTRSLLVTFWPIFPSSTSLLH